MGLNFSHVPVGTYASRALYHNQHRHIEGILYGETGTWRCLVLRVGTRRSQESGRCD